MSSNFTLHEKLWLSSVIEYLHPENETEVEQKGELGKAKINLLMWMLRNNRSSCIGTSIRSIAKTSGSSAGTTEKTLKLLVKGGFLYKDSSEMAYYIDFKGIK